MDQLTVRESVVNLQAADLTELLRLIGGREVSVQTSEEGQRSVRLDLAAAPIRTVEMWWGERLLAVLANPNLAMVPMMLGVYGIMYELHRPGWGVVGQYISVARTWNERHAEK